MKAVIVCMFCLVLGVTIFAATIDWSDADSREDAKYRLEKIDQLFERRENILTFLKSFNDHRGFAVGIFQGISEDRFWPQLILSKNSWNMGREAAATERFLNELLEITQSKLDSLMEVR